MRQSLRITIKNLQKKIPINRKTVQNTISKVFFGEHVKKSARITVSFVTDSIIRKLNKKFLGINEPTDVLAFDMEQAGRGCDLYVRGQKTAPFRVWMTNGRSVFRSKKPQALVCGALLADIIISTDTLLRNSATFKTKPDWELRLYLVHGTLHLLGYGDYSSAETEIMRKKEKRYVN